MINYEIALTQQRVEFFNPAFGETSHYTSTTADETRNFPEFVEISSVEELAAYYVANSSHISERMRDEIFLNPKFDERFFNRCGLTFIVIEEESSFRHLELASVEPESEWNRDWNTIHFNINRTISPHNFEFPPDDSPQIWYFVVDVAYWILEPHREFSLNIETYQMPCEFCGEYDCDCTIELSATPLILNFGVIQHGQPIPNARTVTLTNAGNVLILWR